jgi:hypothetical protein
VIDLPGNSEKDKNPDNLKGKPGCRGKMEGLSLIYAM